MSKEAKVGLLGILSLTILYLGFNFLKGLDIFRTENEYYVYYTDVEGLQTSNPVVFNGVTVGRVMAIDVDQEKAQVKVTLAVNRKINMTDKTIALMTDNGLLGGKMIKLLINKGTTIGDEATLQPDVAEGMVTSITNKLDPTLRNADSLMVNLTKIVKQFDQTGQALKTVLASANQTTTGVNGLLASNAKNIAAITANASTLTLKLNDLTTSMDAQIKPILQKTNTFADSLNAIQLGQTVAQLNASVAGLQGILKEINSGKGTMGKLAKDDSLYTNLDRTAANAAKLLEDLKSHPKRYVHFSLFGKKDKK
ncbi:MAG: MlaD family protein [Spirosomaceae bacterium]|jgi:phospholipid/cholesterol/gamma-HCH transport system substrate-binding protein|nr:MlaD family protein [Spirosomataceae bacterium]